MRAGTRMPAFSLTGISQMQSPAGLAFIADVVGLVTDSPSGARV